jgi:hypothetical protein
MTETPRPSLESTLSPIIACDLNANDLSMQGERWKRLFAQAGVGRANTPGGVRLSFHRDSAVEEELGALVAIENGCCSWASWDVSRQGNVLVMVARSTGEGIGVLHGMFLDLDQCCAYRLDAVTG